MESAATTLLDKIAEYGPGWLIAAALIIFAGYVVHRLLKVYEDNQHDRLSQQREMIEVSGRMVDQMARSNTVIESVEKQMEVMNNTNATMVQALTQSQQRSQGMADDTKQILDRVNFIFKRLVQGE